MDSQYELIVQTASRLFYQYGIRNVSIEDVCTELRISKKTFYAHFSQKEELVDAIITFNKEIHLEKFSKNIKGKNAIQALVYIVKEIKKTADCQPHLMWHDLEKFYPKVFEKHDSERRRAIKEGFEQNLLQGIQEGYYREDLDIELTSLFHTIQLKSTFELMEHSSKKYSKKRLLDFFIDLVIHLIVNEKGLKYVEEHYFKGSTE
jgi:AcrR family transcriptional regulator